MKLVESGIGVVVAVIMIFALGQGNLKKNVNGQEEFQPESGTSADISESSTQDMSYSDTEGAAQQYLATAEDAAIPDQRNGQYVQFVNYTNPDVSGKERTNMTAIYTCRRMPRMTSISRHLCS